MWWRLTHWQFEEQKGERNRKALERIVQSGEIPGLLAYQGNEPIGWVCVGPRERLTRLARSKILAPVDDQPVWSVVCFFIEKRARTRGVATALLEAAVNYAWENGARIVEGYPAPDPAAKIPDAFAWTGLETIFERAGFQLALRRGKSRSIWRRQKATS